MLPWRFQYFPCFESCPMEPIYTPWSWLHRAILSWFSTQGSLKTVGNWKERVSLLIIAQDWYGFSWSIVWNSLLLDCLGFAKPGMAYSRFSDMKTKVSLRMKYVKHFEKGWFPVIFCWDRLIIVYFDHIGALCGHIPNAVRSGVFSLFILYWLRGAGLRGALRLAPWRFFLSSLWFFAFGLVV